MRTGWIYNTKTYCLQARSHKMWKQIPENSKSFLCAVYAPFFSLGIVMWSQHEQRQDSETEAATWNSAIIHY